MTLSSGKVQRTLNKHFTCAWINTEGDPIAGASYAHDPSDAPPTCIRGNGEHNLQLLVLTPQGEVLSVLAGYLTPEDFLEELEFALATLKETVGKEPDQREALVTKAHLDFVKELDEREFKGPLADAEKRRALADHRFAAKHPLMPVDSFRTERLVGNSRTFFGAYSGDKPRGELGEGPDIDIDELLRRARGEKN